MSFFSRDEEKRDQIWDTRLTEVLVTEVFGADQWLKACPSLRSMADRPVFCHYHYHEALDMMNRYIESNLMHAGLLGVYKDYDQFSELMLKIRANIVAFVQSLHAISDTCAHMLYYSLALDKLPKPLRERDICVKEVLKLLAQRRSAEHTHYDRLRTLFEEITDGEDYKYLCALANTLKHRSIVRPELNEDFTGKRDERWILFLESFSYAGETFGQTNAREFMRKEHDRIQPLTVKLGVELNEVLKKQKIQI